MTEKIAIIGGGPAGLSAAIVGAKMGMEVTLFEGNKIGSNINCAEGYIDSMKLLGPPTAGIRYKVKDVLVSYKKTHKIKAKSFNLWMIDRATWQQSLAETARKKGVKIFEDKKITAEDLDFLIKEFDWVLDGSGVPSVTSIYYKFRHIYQEGALITVQYSVKGNFSNFDKTLKFVLFTDNPGYGWIFPKGEDYANIGLGLFNPNCAQHFKGHELYQKLDNFLNEQGVTGEILNRSAGVCPNKQPDRLVFDNLLLIGDAAGLTSPLHGGGIDLACLSGNLAVKTIAEGKVQEYKDIVRDKFHEKLKLEHELKKLWDKKNPFFNDLLNLLDCQHSFSKRAYLLLKNMPSFWRYRYLLKRIWITYYKKEAHHHKFKP